MSVMAYAGLLVRLTANELVAMLVGTSFAAGLNVYATVATLGLLARFDLLPLPDSLHLLENWWIIAASIVLFVIEFFADKVPAFDLIWNALHTFVRVPIAALLAYAATSQLSPGKQTPRHATWRPHCAGRARRQDGSAGGGNSIT